MKAGRELDALIAEKVMGWKIAMRLCAGSNEIESLYDGDDPKSAYYKGAITELKKQYPKDIQPCIVHDVYFDVVPHYSTQIADAKLTTTKILEMPNVSEVVIVGRADGGWNVGFLDNNGVSFAGDWGETEELARCLAALKAVGVVV